MSNIKNIYVKKGKVIIFFSISIIFTSIFIFLFDDIVNFETKPFKSLIGILGFILFSFGVFLSIYLFLRKSPLVSILDDAIIINMYFQKEIKIKFENVESFFIVETRHRGIVSNRQIFIELKKPSIKYSNSVQYKFLKKIMPLKVANSQYSIQTNFLDINHDELLKILNKKLKDFNKSKN